MKKLFKNASFGGIAVMLAILVISVGILPNMAKAGGLPTNVFAMTVDTTKPGASGNDQFTIPTFLDDTYNYNVDWGDTKTDTGVTGDITHTYISPGIHEIQISGTFPRIYFNDGGDASKLLSVDQWGSIAWDSMASAFNYCVNLTSIPTASPDLSNVTDMSSMFAGDSSFNSDISGWDTSHVTDMNSLFQNATSFNQPVGSWNVSNVTNISAMFQGASAFDQDLSTWNTSKVTAMDQVFQDATSFNHPLNSWDVSNVTTMFNMFAGATSFNQPLASWNVGNVETMKGMFRSTPFNQPLNSWNTGNVGTTELMFAEATSFNQPLDKWDTSKVMTMRAMFVDDASFSQNIASWNVGNVVTMKDMFVNDTLPVNIYDAILNAWSGESIHNNVQFGAGSSTYCAAVDARNKLTGLPFKWAISDGGAYSGTFSLIYDKNAHGSVSGKTNQDVGCGGSGDPVTAVPDPGYQFVNWTGDYTSTDNPLTDSNVTHSIVEKANFAPLPAAPAYQVSGGISGGDSSVTWTPQTGFVHHDNGVAASPSGPTPAANPLFTKNLKKGSTSPDVKRLQAYLRLHGFAITPEGKETTVFGSKTKTELMLFQKSVGLAADGSFGTKTRAYVNSHL